MVSLFFISAQKTGARYRDERHKAKLTTVSIFHKSRSSGLCRLRVVLLSSSPAWEEKVGLLVNKNDCVCNRIDYLFKMAYAAGL